ncbi:hypothetical protein B7P43_G03607 [Cryptotermes secundus]|uniref:Uncharacterized protein n=1 Tax=Cryptotermes secundus TaxID=105785 RepID=A0A2J7PSW5_9NEOP|nr:hypothetical protein B7P43_G03607 [Cryptotermes secundus]
MAFKVESPCRSFLGQDEVSSEIRNLPLNETARNPFFLVAKNKRVGLLEGGGGEGRIPVEIRSISSECWVGTQAGYFSNPEMGGASYC